MTFTAMWLSIYVCCFFPDFLHKNDSFTATDFRMVLRRDAGFFGFGEYLVSEAGLLLYLLERRYLNEVINPNYDN